MSVPTPRTACVIPAYQAERTLPDVVRGLRENVPDGIVLVVNDGSTDATLAAARSCADGVLSFRHNRGKGAALRAGFDEALRRGATAVLTIDADGQHDPANAPLLLRALADADVAIGARARRGSSMPLSRRLTNRLASTAMSVITRRELPDSQSGYRAFRRAMLEAVRGEGDRYEYETDLLIRAAHQGFRIVAVPVTTRYGPRSHFRALRDSVRVVRTIWRHRHGALPA